MGCVRSLVGGATRFSTRCCCGVPSRRSPGLRVHVQSVWVLAERADLRLRLVSPGARRVAPLLLRQLDDAAALGVDVDWIGSVGVADSPLWAMGFLRRRMVLDPWPHLGPGLGVVGVRARLRQLVSTRMEQPCRVRVQCQVGTAAMATTIGMAGPSCRIGGFGHGYVNANVINSTHIDVRTRSTFVVRDAAPDVRGYAVPRASAPIRSVGAPNGAVVNGNTAGNAAAYRGSGHAPLRAPRPLLTAIPPRRSAAGDHRLLL